MVQTMNQFLKFGKTKKKKIKRSRVKMGKGGVLAVTAYRLRVSIII